MTSLLHLIQIYDHLYILCQAAYQVFRCKARLSNREECSLLVEGIINCLVILPSARQCLWEEANMGCVMSITVAEDRALVFLGCFLCCRILTSCYSLKITIITSILILLSSINSLSNKALDWKIENFIIVKCRNANIE